ncbi:hypothetical protein NECID01_1934 [Nematocida sp. AWRm77]|nr:hypothetical protein NECID01_1934 [Nematocida sp. AWRm77]
MEKIARIFVGSIILCGSLIECSDRTIKIGRNHSLQLRVARDEFDDAIRSNRKEHRSEPPCSPKKKSFFKRKPSTSSILSRFRSNEDHVSSSYDYELLESSDTNSTITEKLKEEEETSKTNGADVAGFQETSNPERSAEINKNPQGVENRQTPEQRTDQSPEQTPEPRTALDSKSSPRDSDDLKSLPLSPMISKRRNMILRSHSLNKVFSLSSSIRRAWEEESHAKTHVLKLKITPDTLNALQDLLIKTTDSICELGGLPNDVLLQTHFNIPQQDGDISWYASVQTMVIDQFIVNMENWLVFKDTFHLMNPKKNSYISHDFKDTVKEITSLFKSVENKLINLAACRAAFTDAFHAYAVNGTDEQKTLLLNSGTNMKNIITEIQTYTLAIIAKQMDALWFITEETILVKNTLMDKCFKYSSVDDDDIDNVETVLCAVEPYAQKLDLVVKHMTKLMSFSLCVKNIVELMQNAEQPEQGNFAKSYYIYYLGLEYVVDQAYKIMSTFKRVKIQKGNSKKIGVYIAIIESLVSISEEYRKILGVMKQDSDVSTLTGFFNNLARNTDKKEFTVTDVEDLEMNGQRINLVNLVRSLMIFSTHSRLDALEKLIAKSLKKRDSIQAIFSLPKTVDIAYEVSTNLQDLTTSIIIRHLKEQVKQMKIYKESDIHTVSTVDYKESGVTHLGQPMITIDDSTFKKILASMKAQYFWMVVEKRYKGISESKDPSHDYYPGTRPEDVDVNPISMIPAK